MSNKKAAFNVIRTRKTHHRHFNISAMSLYGKVFLITGAAKGLGKSFALALLDEGAKVTISDVSQKDLERTAQEFIEEGHGDHIHFYPCDVRKVCTESG